MKLHGLKLRGIGRFRDTVDLPIGQLADAQVIAVAGANGAGKSTMLEALPGVLYRTTPSRGAIAGMANAKDSFIEAVVETDQVYTIRLLVDGVARNKPSEGYITDSAGAPLVSGKVRDMDAAVARLFPSPEVFFASAFAAQNHEGRFLDLPAVARKALFAKLLGLGRLELLAERASAKVAAVEKEIAALTASADELRAKAGDVDRLRAELTAAEAGRSEALARRAQAETGAAAAQAQLQVWQDRRAELQAATAEVRREVESAAARLADSQKALDTEQQWLANLSAKRAQIEERIAQRANLRGIADSLVECEAKLADAEREIEGAREAEAAHLRAMSAWQDAKSTTERRLRDAENTWRMERTEASSAVREQQREVERLAMDAAALSGIPCNGEGAYADCRLIASAAKARASLPAAQAKLEDLQRRVGALSTEPPGVVGARSALEQVGPAPSKPGGAEALRTSTEISRLREAVRRAHDARGKLGALDELAAQGEQIDAEADALRGTITEAAEALTAIADDLRAAKVRHADATLAEGQHAATMPTVPDPKELERLRAEEVRLAMAAARAEQALASAGEAAARVEEVERQAGAATADLDDWKHLAQALGRNGIQALEIDASGPEVSELTNKLLHACYGPRFSVSLETTALKADGKSTKEVFDLRVIDTERGVDGSADQLSGGEKVLVSEALALAIAIFNCRRSAQPLLTLFRDECAGALSTANAVRYVEMLRRAVELGGFHRVYFIAHQPQLWSLADACLVFEDGRVRIAGEVEDVSQGEAANDAAA
jgi:exonuclease SbcC